MGDSVWKYVLIFAPGKRKDQNLNLERWAKNNWPMQLIAMFKWQMQNILEVKKLRRQSCGGGGMKHLGSKMSKVLNIVSSSIFMKNRNIYFVKTVETVWKLFICTVWIEARKIILNENSNLWCHKHSLSESKKLYLEKFKKKYFITFYQLGN